MRLGQPKADPAKPDFVQETVTYEGTVSKRKPRQNCRGPFVT